MCLCADPRFRWAHVTKIAQDADERFVQNKKSRRPWRMPIYETMVRYQAQNGQASWSTCGVLAEYVRSTCGVLPESARSTRDVFCHTGWRNPRSTVPHPLLNIL